MTICLVSTIDLDSPNGVASFHRHFIRLFTDAGHSIVYLFIDINNLSDGEDLVDKSLIWGNLVQVTLRKKFFQEYQKHRRYFRAGGSDCARYISAGLAARQWLLTNFNLFNIDIIETSDGGGIATYLIDKRLPKVFLTGHGSNMQISRYDHTAYDEHGRILKKLEKLAYQHSDAIITHSPFNKIDLVSLFKRQVYFCNIPFSPVEVPSSDKEEKEHAVVVGTLRRFKGPDLLCKALVILKTKLPQFAVKWIGNDSNSFFNRAGTFQYLKKTFPDIVGNSFEWCLSTEIGLIKKIISEAAFVIIPSRWETYNYVALEAASLGKAIIITNNTGASFLFTDGFDALITNSNEHELAQAIARLYVDSNLRKRIGENARKTIKLKFESNHIVEERIKIYAELMAESQKNHLNLEMETTFLTNRMTKIRRLYFSLRSFTKSILSKLMNGENNA